MRKRSIVRSPSCKSGRVNCCLRRPHDQLQLFRSSHTDNASSTANETTFRRVLLSDVNSWRRRLYFYLEQMKWNIEQLTPPLPRAINASQMIVARPSIASRNDKCSDSLEKPEISTAERLETLDQLSEDETDDEDGLHDHPILPAFPSPHSNPDPWTPHAHDLSLILSHLTLTQKRIQSLLPVVMGAFSLLEAQHSVLKADLTIRLSGVALVFVPLSFTASLLSMSGEFIPVRSFKFRPSQQAFTRDKVRCVIEEKPLTHVTVL